MIPALVHGNFLTRCKPLDWVGTQAKGKLFIFPSVGSSQLVTGKTQGLEIKIQYRNEEDLLTVKFLNNTLQDFGNLQKQCCFSIT